jgi:16S rRNA (uracil1498-N3)-methyltransferase
MGERFFCADAASGGPATLTGDEARHLARVCRLGPGAVVELFDGQGHATRARVVLVGKDHVDLAPLGTPLPDRAPPLSLTLATAVPKGDRFDWLVEKATELGVARLIPLITERSVVDPRVGKLDRLRRSVIEACKQCGRNRIMVIDPPVRWVDLTTVGAPDLRLFARPGGLAYPQWPRPTRGQAVCLVIGPEGGFTDEELARARAEGWFPVGLGATLLRVETAAIAGATRVLGLGESV